MNHHHISKALYALALALALGVCSAVTLYPYLALLALIFGE